MDFRRSTMAPRAAIRLRSGPADHASGAGGRDGRATEVSDVDAPPAARAAPPDPQPGGRALLRALPGLGRGGDAGDPALPALSGYPQVGGHGLHIAHMLWGGLLMVLAI